jgi:hypothetical protein
MGEAPDRLARLSRAIADGSYAPDPDAVAESVLGWIAPPATFERSAAMDRFESPEGTVEGPLDPSTAGRDTAAGAS